MTRHHGAVGAMGAVAAVGLAVGAASGSTIHVVEAIGMQFVPADIVVQAGDTIVWTYVSGFFHTVTSGVNCTFDNEFFNEALFEGVDVVYDVPRNYEGVIDYFCIPHCADGMVGTVTVQLLARCPADFDGSGIVDTADMLQLLSAWGTNAAAFDLDASGIVDAADLLAVLGSWGPCG